MMGLPKLDRIDINILTQLQNNGRLTNIELADTVGLSPSPCLARVKRLEKADTRSWMEPQLSQPCPCHLQRGAPAIGARKGQHGRLQLVLRRLNLHADPTLVAPFQRQPRQHR